jgi:aminoglycoside phosphotransferase family enzyme/predicted kinase
MHIKELIAGLSDKSAYPHPVESVEVFQTHISVVFLAGPFAYKIKKPVDLGFLDYSTLERRRHFCDEELRLNRRLAPSVYLEVVPITRNGDQIKLNGNGPVFEWAVKMQRLPDDATLGARIKKGEVGTDAIAELARRLAEFHDRAQAGPQVAKGASFEAVARNAGENFEQSKNQVGKTLSSKTHARLKARTEKALADLKEVIENRALRGIPRDTHGDLRLDHVYWFPDKRPPDDWLVVDCVEFNDRFRHADPIAELAFLTMELLLEGQHDLADTFIEAYLRARRDEEGRALLPFYRAYRAAVRAKVEAMKLDEPEIGESEKSAALAKARARWLFALGELEEPRSRPCLVLVAGLPGTGKSTLAARLGEEAGFSVVRSDVVRKELVAAHKSATPATSSHEDFYTALWNDRTYEECLRRAQVILFEGGRALVDASFHDEARRRHFLEAARRWGVPGCLILCHADPDIVRDRLGQRQNDASDADWAIHHKVAQRWDELGEETHRVAHQVDTSGSQDEAFRRALEVLRKSGLAGAH